MQITVSAGGRTWIVDENRLLNWLVSNAVQAGGNTTTVKEVVNDGNNEPRTLLNESRN